MNFLTASRGRPRSASCRRWVLGGIAGAAIVIGGVGPCAAAQIDTLGATHHEWSGSSQCRGAKVRAVQDALLLGFDISLKNTQGTRVTFFAYEAYADGEAYERIASATAEKTGSVGDTFAWEPSPPMHVLIGAQKYYVLLACWGDHRQTGYRGSAAIAPQDMAFGEYLGGAYFDSGNRPPESAYWATATHDYYVRVHSGPRAGGDAVIPFHDLDPFADDPTRGRPGVRGNDGTDPADQSTDTRPVTSPRKDL